MRVLHVVKTSEGAQWAAKQAKKLANLGVDVHVALPSSVGPAVIDWIKANTKIHIVDCSLPIRLPYLLKGRIQRIRTLVNKINPDLIHSHFVSTTLMLRLSLGKFHHMPIAFQVPGPLHLEYPLHRLADILTAGENDYWIASSQYTYKIYSQYGFPLKRIFLSYYGIDVNKLVKKHKGTLYAKLGLPYHYKIVGNISFMYPPKYYLGHTKGIKRHENLIDAIAIVCKKRSDIVGVIVGGQWGSGKSYENRLRKRAERIAGDRIIFTGDVSNNEALSFWPDIYCAIHIPMSENCGGIIEPLLNEVPTIASNIGGLPEVVIDGITGRLVPKGNINRIAETILYEIENYEEAKKRAKLGAKLVQKMFDVNRTAKEIYHIYEHLINQNCPVPEKFDYMRALNEL